MSNKAIINEMVEITDNEDLRKVQIDVMRKVHAFCVENGLTYYLWGGTLLGAIRHGGYIPWDDDIDIAMPRKDYDFFVEHFDFEDYGVYSCEKNNLYPFVYAKAFSKKTVKIEPIALDKNYSIGIDVDIFPIDPVCDMEKLERDIDERYSLIKKWRSSVFKFTKTKSILRFAKRLLKSCKCSVGRALGIYNANKLAKKINQKAQEYQGEHEYIMLYADNNLKKPMCLKKEWCEQTVLHKFESDEFYVMTGYHETLTKVFGDYMTPPPAEKRVAHHTFKVYINKQ